MDTVVKEVVAVRGPGKILRSVGAVFAGLLLIVVLSSVVDAVLHATGVFPPYGEAMADGLFVVPFAYRVVISLAGCFVAARLAASRRMRHAMVLGWIGVAISAAGTIATWNRGPEFGPKWYAIALIIVALPCAWVGGVVERRVRGA